MQRPRTTLVVVLLVLIGLSQMIGEVTGNITLRDFGMATAAAPAPKIFSSINGFEPFSNSVFLEWEGRIGSKQSLLITPELYAELAGPFSRRNIFVSILTMGPVLAVDSRWDTLFKALSRFALCDLRPLLGELGVDPYQVVGDVNIELYPLDINNTDKFDFSMKVHCL